MGNQPGALKAYEALASGHPGWAAAHFGLGSVLATMGRHDRAIKSLERAARLDGRNPRVLAVLAAALGQQGRADESLATLDRALAMSPGDTQSLVVRSEVLRMLGRSDEALATVEGAHREGNRHPALVTAFAQLAGSAGRVDDGVEAIEAVMGDAKVHPMARSSMLFTLGGLLDKAERYGRAFEAYAEANRSRGAVYDPAVDSAACEDRVSAWSAERMAGLPRGRSVSEVPVFVVGMPRSGTTLVEQIVASHAEGAGAGELVVVQSIARELVEPTRAGQGRGERLDGLQRASVDRGGRAVLKEMTRASGGGAARVVDKTPHNYQHVGLIELMLPKARVIHCVRDAMDTCLSCFFHDFGGRMNFGCSYRLVHLAHAYRLYERQMAHWRGVSGLEILEVKYEDLVSDQDAQTRRIVEFVGLEWDDACLRFYETQRAVTTHSMEQVRKPMYSSSVGRWKHYESQLDELRRGLGER